MKTKAPAKTTARTAAAARAALDNLAGPATETTPAVLTAPPAAGPADPTNQRVPLALLTRSHLNPRRTFDADAIRDLAESIVTQGLLQNVVVRKDVDQPIYWIVAGERRLRALQLLQEEGRLPSELAEHGVPCRIIEADDAQHLALALLENLQRVDVNPMEEARGFAQLQALDPVMWTTEEIARAIGKIRATGKEPEDQREIRSGMRFVQQRLALVKLEPEAQEALQEGKITFSQARALATAPPETQRAIAANAGSYTTEDQIRTAVRQTMFPMDRAFFPMEWWTGPLTEDPQTGECFYPDKVQFLRLQGLAVAQKAQELRDSWAWVDVQQYCYEANNPKADRAKAGCVIIMDPYTALVQVREGVVRETKPKQSPEDKAAHQAKLDRIALQEKAAAGWKAALGAKLMAPDQLNVVVSLLLLDRLEVKEYGGGDTVLTYGQAGLPNGLFGATSDLARFSPYLEEAVKGTKRLKDGGLAHNQALRMLLDLHPATLAGALGTWVASRLRIYPHERAHPALVLLSQRYGIKVPVVPLGEEEPAAAPPHQIDPEEAIAATSVANRVCSSALSRPATDVANRVRRVLQDYAADGVTVDDADTLAGDLDLSPSDASAIASMLQEEFALPGLPFKAAADFGFPEMGLETVAALIDYMERRTASVTRAGE